jgi:chorismate dehydratase
MWSFEHPPEAARLAERYAIEKMSPAACAARLGAGEAELGLIPIAAYAKLPGLAIVPGCTIASLGSIRSILLVMRAAGGVKSVRSVALDTASRTSATYTQILFRKYWQAEAAFVPHAAELDAMLAAADAALLIGDPALYALEDREAREARTGERLIYLDLAEAWLAETGLPWVSAFWAAGGGALQDAEQVCGDLIGSRDAGLANVPALAAEWSGRLGLPLGTVAAYLGQNIHYVLDAACLEGIDRFYADAAECGLIDRAPELVFL